MPQKPATPEATRWTCGSCDSVYKTLMDRCPRCGGPGPAPEPPDTPPDSPEGDEAAG